MLQKSRRPDSDKNRKRTIRLFRLQSRYGGTHDETSTYMRIVYSQSEYLHKKDENGLSLDTFDSHRDYVQGEAPSWYWQEWAGIHSCPIFKKRH